MYSHVNGHGRKKARCFRHRAYSQTGLAVQGLLAVGKGQAACGLNVV